MSLPAKKHPITPLRMVYFVLGLAVLFFLLRYINFGELVHVLFSIRPEYLLLAGTGYLFKAIIRGWRFQQMQAGSKQPFWRFLRLTMATSLASQVMPLKLGEFSYVYLVKKEFNAPVAQGLSSLMIIRMCDLLAISLWFILAAFFLHLPGGFSTYLYSIAAFIGVLLAGLIGVIAAIRYFPSRANRLLHAAVFQRTPLLARLQAALVKIMADLGEYPQPRYLRWLFGALAEWLVNFGVYHTLLVGIGLAPHLIDSVVGVTFAALASTLPINSFGNFGTQEGGWMTGLVLMGYTQQAAILSGFATHLLSLAFMLIFGGSAWLTYLVRKESAPQVA
jgi:glycosyltransferase 2 family protein